MHIMRFTLPLALLLLTTPAFAQDEAALIAEGRKLSDINCTRCHNIEATGESPLTDAMPFREMYKDFDRYELIDGFMEGLAVRHPLMPDWEVTEPQAEALAAFVMSLGEGAKVGDSPILVGYELLRVNCARCHAIDMESASAEPKAPPFRDVVKKYEPAALEEALAEGIMTGHEQMPEFTFEPDQVTAIIAYLDTLKSP
ncbi:c-type cytochrome [Aestuariivirga sp.]|uniref:c-type cytochrome n=1 Tax=Aestuariivirga sp. TaxID=2650926 RepID=UPI00359446C1